MADREDRHWTVDRKIPLALILAIIGQTVGAIWWARGLDARVEALEKGAVTVAPQGERIIRLETRLEAIMDSLVEIKAIIRRDRQEPR